MDGRQKIKAVCLALCGSFVAGCSVNAVVPMKADIERSSADATEKLGVIQHSKGLLSSGPGFSPVEKTAGIYLPVRKIAARKSDKGDNDPALRRQIGVNSTFVSAQDFAERITVLTGIPVGVQPDVVPQNNNGLANTMPTGAVGATGLPSLPSPMTGGMNTMGMPGMYAPNASGFPLNLSYSGSVAGLLDSACSRMGVSWEMSNGEIKLFRYVSKTFRLSALPGDTSMNAGIGNTTSSGSSATNGGTNASSQSNSSAQQAGVAFTGLSVWRGIEDSIKAMLTANGKVIVAPALGTVTVTDTPASVSVIEKFIEKQNAALSQQVVVNVRVLSIDLNRGENYGINWDVVYTTMSKNFGFGFSSKTPAITGAAALTAAVLNTAGTSSNSSLQSWQGSKALIEALSTQGKVSSVTSASITTLNNQPSPLQVGRQTSYLASSQTTLTTGVATTSLTPGSVSTGFSMTLVPHVIDGNKMLLQYAIDMSSLIAMNTLASGTTVIQSPDLDARTSIQRVMVSSGDTIVVTGFENSETTATTQGVIDSENPALGGSVLGKRKKSTIVILIQPVLLSNN